MGHPVVLIHGMWCSPLHLKLLASQLTVRGYDCHLPCLPMHQPTPTQADDVAALSISNYADSVRAYIEERAFSQPPVLLGHSMGGLIAQILASRIPAAALVLLTPAAPWGIHALTPAVMQVGLPIFCRWGFWRKSHTLSRARLLGNAMNAHTEQAALKLLPTLLAESGRAATEMGLWWSDLRRATAVPASSVRCPVYVVSAGQDRLTPASVVRKVALRYANSTLRIWPERDHWVIDDADTEDMVHEIDGWLRPVLKRLAAGINTVNKT